MTTAQKLFGDAILKHEINCPIHLLSRLPRLLRGIARRLPLLRRELLRRGGTTTRALGCRWRRLGNRRRGYREARLSWRLWRRGTIARGRRALSVLIILRRLPRRHLRSGTSANSKAMRYGECFNEIELYFWTSTRDVGTTEAPLQDVVC